MTYELAFIGAGNMAEAIAKAALAASVLPASAMVAADPSEPRREVFRKLGIAVTADNADAIRAGRQVLLAVKPQMLGKAAQDLAKHVTAEQVVITILAGVSTQKLADAIAACGGAARRIIRLMPNTPLQVGYGMSGLCRGAGALPGDEAFALKLFGAGGKVVTVTDGQMDAITAVSGSGPAYLFYLAEAMERAARELDLGDSARLLVSQTLLGAAHLLAASPDTAAELRRKVTSPGGTTEAAIKHLDGNKSIDVLVNAVKAAATRSREMGK